jgi:hypothetical protein
MRSRKVCQSGHSPPGATAVALVNRSLRRCAHEAGAQIDHAAGGIQRPWVGVEISDASRMSHIGSGKAFHGRNCAGAGQFFGDGFAVLLHLLGGCRHFAAESACKVEYSQGVIARPAHAVPSQPMSPCGHIEQLPVVPGAESERDRVFAVGWRQRVHIGHRKARTSAVSHVRPPAATRR